MRNFIRYLLASNSDVSSKRFIALCYAGVGLVIAMWLVWKLDNTDKMAVFSYMLTFICAMVGATVVEKIGGKNNAN